jgi:pepF/M3 family oligoendopeptidase
MEAKWSLKELYASFEEERFKEDVKKLDLLIAKVKNWVNDHTVSHDNELEKLEQYITLEKEINSLYEKLAAFAGLTLSVDSQNESATKYDAILEQKMSALAGTGAKISSWISSIEKLDEVIGQSELLKEHSFYLQEIVREQKHMLSEKEEDIIARMQNTGSSAWVNYKNLLIATHKVEIELDGQSKTLPLTEVLNLAYNPNKDIRKKAYEAEIASYKKIEEGVAAALNAIKGEVVAVCEMKGYASPLEMTLESSRMDKETLEAMLSAIKESLPMFRKYLRKKAEKLGYKNGLPFYELYAPVVQKEMPFPYDTGKAFIEKNFRAFSSDLADFAKNAMDKEWIDVFPREGKGGGAFCYGLHSLGECRIMLNYGDNLSDVITMAHELGHGFHDQCLNGESVLNIDSPMPLAETASTFCETIVKKAALGEADAEETLAILEAEISDYTQLVVDIYSRFLFESELFKQREDGPLSPKELNNMMLKAQQEAYGDGLDPEYFHPYMWTWKPHYYYAASNFYNFPYTFGLLFAKGLYAKYEQDKENFPKKYEKLLAVTGKKFIADAAKEMDIDVRNIEFWRSSLKIIEQDIEKFLLI